MRGPVMPNRVIDVTLPDIQGFSKREAAEPAPVNHNRAGRTRTPHQITRQPEQPAPPARLRPDGPACRPAGTRVIARLMRFDKVERMQAGLDCGLRCASRSSREKRT